MTPFSAKHRKKESIDEGARVFVACCAVMHGPDGEAWRASVTLPPAKRPPRLPVVRPQSFTSRAAKSSSSASIKRARLVRLMGLPLLRSAGRHAAMPQLLTCCCAATPLAVTLFGTRGDAVEPVRFYRICKYFCGCLYSLVGVETTTALHAAALTVELPCRDHRYIALEVEVFFYCCKSLLAVL